MEVGHLPKQIFRVGNDKLLFSNIADVTITCYDANTTIVTTDRPTGRQFVVQFQCGCDVYAGEFQVSKRIAKFESLYYNP